MRLDRGGAGSRGRWQPGPRRADAAGDREEVAQDRAARGARRRRPARHSRSLPSGSASISTRFVTPPVRPNGLSAGTAVGSDRGLDGVAVAGRGRQQLDGEPERRGACQLLVGDAGDAGPAVARATRRRPPGHARPGRASAEGETGQDDQLVGRVVALDVAARVGLRVALRLGLGQDVGVGAPVARPSHVRM